MAVLSTLVPPVPCCSNAFFKGVAVLQRVHQRIEGLKNNEVHEENLLRLTVSFAVTECQFDDHIRTLLFPQAVGRWERSYLLPR